MCCISYDVADEASKLILNNRHNNIIKCKRYLASRNMTQRKLLGYIEDTDKVLDQQLPPTFFRVTRWLARPITIQGTCLPVDLVYQTGRDIVTKLILYYKLMNFDVVQPNTPFVFVIPKSTPLQPLKAEASIWSRIVHTLFGWLHVNPRDLLSLLFKDIVSSIAYCNIDAVMFCNQKQTHMPIAFGLVLLVSLVLYYVVSPTLAYTFLFLCAPACTVYLTYRIAPGCFPMVPTCLLDEVVDISQRYLPTTIEFPRELLNKNNQTRSCTELGFKNVQDPLIFLLCHLQLDHLVAPYMVVDTVCSLPREAGYYFCAVISSVITVPLFVLAAMIFVCVLSFVTFVVSMLPSVVVVLYQVIIFDN